MMEKLSNCLMTERIGDILQDLREHDAEYALAMDKKFQLYDMLGPILFAEKSITISVGDCETLRDLLEQEVAVDGIAQGVLYQQGYLDCVKLLRSLGVLA